MAEAGCLGKDENLAWLFRLSGAFSGSAAVIFSTVLSWADEGATFKMAWRPSTNVA